jgi:hypothetical protein
VLVEITQPLTIHCTVRTIVTYSLRRLGTYVHVVRYKCRFFFYSTTNKW